MDQGGTSFFELCREFGLTPTAEVSALLGGASAVQRFREQRSTEQWSKAGPPPAAVSRSSLLLAVAVRDVRMADALGAGLGSLELALDVDSAQLADLVRNAEPLEDVAVRPTCREALACYAELFGSARPLDPIGIGHGIVTNPLGGTILDDLRGAGIDAGAVSLAVGRLMGARYLVDHSFWPVAERVIGRALALAKRSIGVEELRSSLLLIAYGQEGERDAESSAGLARSELDRDGAFASTAKSWIVPRERASSPIEPSLRPLNPLVAGMLGDAATLAGATAGPEDEPDRISGLTLLAALLRVVRAGRPPSGAADFLAVLFETSSPGEPAQRLIDGILHRIETEAPATLAIWQDFFGGRPDSGTGSIGDPFAGATPTAALHCTEDLQGPDRLGITRYVNAFAMLMASKKLEPPLSIGLFGDWGSGKSFFMRKLRDRIAALAKATGDAAESSYHGSIVQIEFNAWHYVDTSLWASIVTHIFEQLHAHFTGGERAAERKQWENLLEKLDEARDLQQQARGELENAEARLAEAQQERESRRRSLAQVGRELWDELARHTQLAGAMAKLRNTLHADQIAELREALLLRRQEVATARLQGQVFKRSLLQGVGSLRSLGIGGGCALAVLVAAAIGTYAFADDNFVQRASEGLGTVLAMLAGVSTWAGDILRRSTGTMKLVGEVAKGVGDVLAKDPERLERLHAAKAGLASATQAVKESEDKLAEVRSQIEGFRPSQRLHSFLADRAASSDYRKHLGLPALIRRDFDRLNRLMRQTFALPADAALEAELAAGRVPADLNTRIGHLPDLPFVARTILSDSGERIEVQPRVTTMPNDSGWLVEDGDQTRSLQVRRRTPAGDAFDCSLLYKPRIDRIVLYIDDLDRCPPTRVVEVLQAIHLLLTFPLFIVVVGVDARWVSRSLRRQFRELWHGSRDGEQRPATPHDYLEKIFQVPFWLRPMSATRTGDYLDALVGAPQRPAPTPPTPTPNAVPDTTPDAATPPPADANANANANANDEEPRQRETDAATRPRATVEQIPLISRQLELRDEERLAMRRLAVIHGRSPRAVKRLVNVYYLIRAGLGEAKLDAYVDAGDHEVVLFLLSVIVGAPESARIFCQVVEQRPHDERLPELASALGDALRTAAENEPGMRTANGANATDRLARRTERRLAEIASLERDIAALDRDFPFGAGRMRQWLDEVRRYSFRVG